MLLPDGENKKHRDEEHFLRLYVFIRISLFVSLSEKHRLFVSLSEKNVSLSKQLSLSKSQLVAQSERQHLVAALLVGSVFIHLGEAEVVAQVEHNVVVLV